MTDPRPPIPRDVRVRLADVPRHLNGLRHALEAFATEDDYVEAARSRDPAVLLGVYAVERPFELLENYMVELTERGLAAAGAREEGADPSAASSFRLLRDEGVLSKSLCERLVDLHRLRNDLVHEYPDVKGRRLYRAATELDATAREYFSRYLKWLDELGFDVPSG